MTSPQAHKKGAPTARDNDYGDADLKSFSSASDFSSSSSLGSGDEGDDSRYLRSRRVRTSADVRRSDQRTLKTEEEAERLLSGDAREKGNGAGPSDWFTRGDTSRSERWGAKGRRRSLRNETRSLVFDMEEGGAKAGSEDEAEDEDDQWVGDEKTAWQEVGKVRPRTFALIHIVTIGAFIGLLFATYKASQSLDQTKPFVAITLSNGTSNFAPTTILISLDGFRADFLSRNVTPSLEAFLHEGVSAPYMRPSFPSLTFPNHFTIATGRHPESHGIVANNFWDPETNKSFFYVDPPRSMQPEWWNAEPIWETAETQGLRTAIHMWPGSEAHIGDIEPTFVDKYKGDELLENKVNRILHWLDLPGEEDGNDGVETRPQFIAAYVPNVDSDGHNFGPNSTDIRTTIRLVDGMLGDLFQGIDQRNLTDIVNIVIVSDHGMASTDVSRLIQLEDLIDLSLIEHTDGWPLYGLRPYDNSEQHLADLYNTLWAKSQTPKYRDAFDVYLRDVNMPPRYHFSQNKRIAPLWIVPRTGWALVTKSEFDVELGVKGGLEYHPRGLHGYDNQHPLMRAIFAARGPAFSHATLQPGSRIAPFQNTEVYNLLCNSLGIKAARNNGALRLPLKAVGMYEPSLSAELQEVSSHAVPAIAPLPEFSTLPPVVVEAEPSSHPSSATTKPQVIFTTDATGSIITVSPEVAVAMDAVKQASSSDKQEGADENLNNGGHFWGWFEEKLDSAKSWALDLLGKGKGGEDGDGSD